jgi:hypothetical protein
VHQYADDLGNIAFLTNDSGSVTTTYAYSPDGAMVEHGWAPPNRQYTFQGAGPVSEELPGLYRVGTDLYHPHTARKLPGRLKYTPPSLASKKLFVGGLSFSPAAPPVLASKKLFVGNLPLSSAGEDGPMPQTREHILLARQVGLPSSDGPMPQTREHILLARQVGGAHSGAAPLAVGVLQPGDPVRIQSCVSFTGPSPVGFDSGRFNGKYYVTGAGHIYLPDNGGYPSLFRLGHSTSTADGDHGTHEVGHWLGR